MTDLVLGSAGADIPSDLVGLRPNLFHVGLDDFLKIGRHLLFAAGLPIAFDGVGGHIVDLFSEGGQSQQTPHALGHQGFADTTQEHHHGQASPVGREKVWSLRYSSENVRHFIGSAKVFNVNPRCALVVKLEGKW